MTAHVTDLYPFSNARHQLLFNKLIHMLRCRVCQNQPLSDSNSPFAFDLKSEIYNQVLANHSEEQIIGFVTQRYGSTILYEPPLTNKTIFLWCGPLFISLVAFLCIKKYFKYQ